MRSRLVVRMVSVGALSLGMSMVSGQDFPSRPIRIVTSNVGGSSDFVARHIASGLTANLGQSVIVDNRAIPAEIVSKAPPHGHTLIVDGSSCWVAPLLQKMPYDFMRDFSPITLAITQPNVLVVHPSVAANSVKELIALAKAKPGALNYASGNTGGSAHLAGELFKSMAGVNIVRVAYKGSALAITGLIGGETQLMITDTNIVAPHVKLGKLRALAVTTAQPSALAPGLATVSAAGLPGYESMGMSGLFAPTKTPGPIINRLSQETVRVLSVPDVKEKFFSVGSEVVGSSPEKFAAEIKADINRWSKVIKDAGIQVN